MKTDQKWGAALFLENGHLFEGMGFGATTSRGGEAVFNTGMSGYQEIFTDPSYLEQVVVMTCAHLGNTGFNLEDVESDSLHLRGVVAREYCEIPSNWRSKGTLSTYLAQAGVPGISDVDTRAITQILRDEGSQRCIIFPSDGKERSQLLQLGKQLLEKVPHMDGLELVSQISCREPYWFKSAGDAVGETVVVYDYGVKTNILRLIAARGFRVYVVPYNTPATEVLKLAPVAVVLSNGPGDPSRVEGVVPEIQSLIGKVPLFAICMGHQLLARSLGCTTYKMKFGHHGINHPVMDLRSKEIFITSQNHGFAVRATDFDGIEAKVSHISLNDQSVEGFFSEAKRLFSVQFHPEAKPGPNEAGSIFDQFVKGFVK